MGRLRNGAIPTLALLAVSAIGSSQLGAFQGGQGEPARIRTATEAALLDIVEHDKDGRPIEVPIKRNDVEAQSRGGYLASPPGGGLKLLPSEQAMASVLMQASLPSDLGLKADLLRFAPQGQGNRFKLILEVPLKDLEFRDNKKEKQYEAEVALLALIKGENGDVLEKFSQSYPIHGALKNKEVVQQGDVVFIKDLALRPGRYTLEAVAHDQAADKFSARRTEFEVPRLKAGVQLSSVVVVKRTEDLKKDASGSGDALEFQKLKLTPSLGEPIVKTPETNVVLYMIIYPDKDLHFDPEMGLEFSQAGQVIGATQPQLPGRDANGNIPFIITFPMDYFNPGHYRVRAVVQQGNTSAESAAEFSVVKP